MPVVQCPKCKAVFHTDDLIPVHQLSPAARHILHQAPPSFLHGQIVSVQVIADMTGYSRSRAHFALCELARAGYVERIPRGVRKHVYRGVPEAAR